MTMTHALATLPHTLATMQHTMAALPQEIPRMTHFVKDVKNVAPAIIKAAPMVDAGIGIGSVFSLTKMFKKKHRTPDSEPWRESKRSAVTARQQRSGGRGRYTRETETTHRVRESYDDY